MGFFSRLETRARQIGSLLCVGLDPHISDLGAPTPEAAHAFCLRLIEATADVAVAFKPNVAFFEAFGPPGLEVLQQVIKAIPAEVPVILDAKRGDIASTAQAYAHSAFQIFGAQAITINPYLGYDAIDPFLKEAGYGVFLLCKTSNPGAADLQDLTMCEPGQPALYEVVARLAQRWNVQDNLGLVVGATQPQALARLRAIAPDLWFLAPGIGAQGGDLQAALRAGLRRDGLGMLLPVSRAISRPDDPRQAALQMRDAINQERQAILSQQAPEQSARLSPLQSEIADGLLATGCVKFGEFRLKSGLISPIYLDLRQLASYPRLLARVGQVYLSILQGLSFDRLAALPYAALPIATSISLQSGWPMIYPRKEVKAYGTQVEIEGVYQAGEQVVVIDDLATTGGSKFEAIDKLVAAGLRVADVVVLVDRQSGAAQSLAQAGYRLHAALTLTQMLDYWEAIGKVPTAQIQATRNFLQS